MIPVAGLVRTSTVDFPGFLAAVVFVPGCNFSCFYCHNRRLLEPGGEQIAPEELMGFLNRRRGLLEGIVITGGEPLLQPELPDFIRQLKSMGYKVKLDTNGSRPLMLQRLLSAGLLDQVAIDYKAPWDRYPRWCRSSAVDAAAVRSSLDVLLKSDICWEARTTVFPQLGRDDLFEMARAVPMLPAWVLQLYRKPDYYLEADRDLVETPGCTPQNLRDMAQALVPLQPNTKPRTFA